MSLSTGLTAAEAGKGKTLCFPTILSQNPRAAQVGKDLQDHQGQTSTGPTEPCCCVTPLSASTEGRLTEIAALNAAWKEANQNGAPHPRPPCCTWGRAQPFLSKPTALPADVPALCCRTLVKTLPEHLKKAVVISLPVASYENRLLLWLRGSRGPEGRSPRQSLARPRGAQPPPPRPELHRSRSTVAMEIQNSYLERKGPARFPRAPPGQAPRSASARPPSRGWGRPDKGLRGGVQLSRPLPSGAGGPPLPQAAAVRAARRRAAGRGSPLPTCGLLRTAAPTRRSPAQEAARAAARRHGGTAAGGAQAPPLPPRRSEEEPRTAEGAAPDRGWPRGCPCGRRGGRAAICGAPGAMPGCGHAAAAALLAGGPAARHAVRLAFWTLIPQQAAKVVSGRVRVAIKARFFALGGAGTAPPAQRARRREAGVGSDAALTNSV